MSLLPKQFKTNVIIGLSFATFTIFVYNKFVAPKLNPSFIENREFTTKPIQSNNSSLYFIYATWCPHSKKVIKHWEKLKDRYNNKVVKNYTVTIPVERAEEYSKYLAIVNAFNELRKDNNTLNVMQIPQIVNNKIIFDVRRGCLAVNAYLFTKDYR